MKQNFSFLTLQLTRPSAKATIVSYELLFFFLFFFSSSQFSSFPSTFYFPKFQFSLQKALLLENQICNLIQFFLNNFG